jgi:hypothetical protein
MRKAVQKSSWPTRKLAFGSGVTAIVGTQLSPAVAEVWPQLVPAFLSGPAVTEIVAAVAALVAGLFVGYWVPDQPNEAVE